MHIKIIIFIKENQPLQKKQFLCSKTSLFDNTQIKCLMEFVWEINMIKNDIECFKWT